MALHWHRWQEISANAHETSGVVTGGISGYIPLPKSVYLKFFMWLFCLLDPGQIRYRAIYTHPNQIPGYASAWDASKHRCSLNLRRRNLDCKNLRFILRILCAGNLGLSPVISAQFSVEMCVAAWNREKFLLKPSIFEARSFKVIDVGTVKIYVLYWEFYMLVISVYLRWFLRNLLLKCVSQPKIAKNLLKPSIFEATSFKVIDVGSSALV